MEQWQEPGYFVILLKFIVVFITCSPNHSFAT